MKEIWCAVNRRHRMVYKDGGMQDGTNGYYCTECGYKELDSELTDDLLRFQSLRVIEC